MAKTKTITTSRGHKIEIRSLPILAVSGLRQDFIEINGEFPKAPTYLSPTDEVLIHNETTLTDDADRVAWAAYEEAATAWDVAFMQFQFGYIGLESVVETEALLEMEAAWVEKMEALDIRLSDNKMRRRVRFIRSEVFTTQDDMTLVSKTLAQLSGAPAEEVKKIEATFQG